MEVKSLSQLFIMKQLTREVQRSSGSLNDTGVRDTNPCAIQNPHLAFDPPQSLLTRSLMETVD